MAERITDRPQINYCKDANVARAKAAPERAGSTWTWTAIDADSKLTKIPENPFRPGAGQAPVYLAGREDEQREFRELLNQKPVLQNAIVTGLRGVGKTVLVETFKPVAQSEGWLWAGNDLSEIASLTEERLLRRVLVDLSTLLAPKAALSACLLSLIAAGFLYLPRRDPHDVDGVADDIGGALLALGSFGHGASMARKRRGDEPCEFGQQRRLFPVCRFRQPSRTRRLTRGMRGCTQARVAPR